MRSEAEIILVEDNVSDADLVMRTLKKNNLANNVLHLQDGQEALDYFFSESSIPKNSSNPKVILLDLKMPRVNGMEVLEQLKANEHTSTIPVVILTSSAEDPDLKKCYELGANSYVVKPVAFEDFVKTISQLGVYWLLVNETKK
ncbi:MAG: two-component system response regulator [Flavobacteriaceae bacterium CG18_big_fil_WC_8_21_14_2_50_34_36]|nr:response regulator [Bacteroidota bacterium]PIQ19537.1 MAG: two-component system response regulator [Flavobacteriaceae bacterium CG18_big_fil_WC_8_21_14_2_50_34_36]PJC08489.1 MAG: two-component system response regulator [Flavobacteriaceae bacterium CG_4_9_14_0_8_um_filter_34_30]